MTRRTPTASTLAALLLLAACGAEEEPAPAPGEADTDAPAAAAAPAQALPDTTAQAVWAHLQREGYTSWALWPGKGRLYQGGEPHGMLLTTYVNGVGMDALRGGAEVLPTGALLVKENYMPDSTLAAVTVMYKTDGFNPDHADWWFMKRLADGTVEASGRVEGCQGCHGGAADNDYILTSDLPLEADGG